MRASRWGLLGLSAIGSTPIITRIDCLSEQPITPATIPAVAESAPILSLVLQSGAQAGLQIPCRRVVTLIGTREGCKIHIPDKRVSPAHVALVNDGTKIIALDLITASGTKLNGLTLEYETLNHGDVIEVASWSFQVRIERSPNYDNADEHPFELEPTPHVVALEHVKTGRLLQPNRDVCIVGRRPGCDIHLDDNRVSRAHALLLTYFGYPAIFDLLTSNGTFVDDERQSFRKLEPDDVLKIGDSEFRIRFAGALVTKKLSSNGSGKKPTTPLQKELLAHPGDEIDIAATESSQRWHIAEKIEKVARR